jgi:hypothetical protein
MRLLTVTRRRDGDLQILRSSPPARHENIHANYEEYFDVLDRISVRLARVECQLSLLIQPK